MVMIQNMRKFVLILTIMKEFNRQVWKYFDVFLFVCLFVMSLHNLSLYCGEGS